MQALAIIPARFDSVRFPGKLLANETGKPLIQHTYEQAGKSKSISRIVVATDDDRIERAVKDFGGEVVRTKQSHSNGTSRIAEAMSQIEQSELDSLDEIIVNVQGDEPEIDPAIIDLAIETLNNNPNCEIGTIAAPFKDGEDSENPNVVKVVCNRRSQALYFSRAAIPFRRDEIASLARLKHVGLYVYRRPFLADYPSLKPTPLEATESLEQLRFLEYGYAIAIGIAPEDSHFNGIDTPQQYAAFVKRMKETA